MPLIAHTCCSRSDKAFPSLQRALAHAGRRRACTCASCPLYFSDLAMGESPAWSYTPGGRFPGMGIGERRVCGRPMAWPWDCQGYYHLSYTPVVWFNIPSRKKGRGCSVKSVSHGFPGKQRLFLNSCCSELVLTEIFQTLDLEDLLPQRSLPLLITLLQHLM